MNMMKKRFFTAALVLLMLVSAGCKQTSSTTLNSEYKIFYGGCQIEATVRELTVDGGTTTARIHFLNLGSETLSSLQALVEFVDAEGNTIDSDVLDLTFSTEITVGEGFSETATCKSNDKIVNVYVTEYTP
ncbi:hypothetical protein SDC9_166965 [bioreactor metagenome]|uniref:Lipoprotein n=1 Tax=bioreactor metagenome TaxID=1076179 RepID=A0A645G629_9ZZZZ